MRFLLRCSVALLLLLGVACSSGAKESAADKTTTSTTTTTIKTLKGDEVDVKASPYCATWAEIRTLGGPKLTGDEAKDIEARKAHYAKLVPLAENLVSQAEASIKPAAQGALAQVRQVAKDGTDAPFIAKGATAMQQELAQYALDHCAK
ncbi:MAG: hypothetical protein JWO68_2084 [Actinomycetia bacterium]|nr:hypothetical protein [Actinomycetes bacterium]